MRNTVRLILALLLFSLTASAQWRLSPYAWQYQSVKNDSLLVPPKILVNPSLLEDGAIRYNGPLARPQFYKFSKWCDFGGSTYDITDTLNNWQLSGPVPSLISAAHTAEGFVENIGGDTLINIFRSDSTQAHASNGGKIVQRYSYDGGINWTAPTTIFNSSNDDRNVIGTITSTGRIVAIFRQYNVNTSTTVSVGYITSTDKGQTWTGYTTVSPSLAGLAPMGNVVRLGNGNYLALLYTTNYCEALVSSNGATWTSQGAVFDYRISNPTRQTTEVYPAYVGNNRVIILARNENLASGPFYQLTSTDNGATFTWQGNTNIGGDSLSRAAPFIVWDSTTNTIITAYGQRHVYNNAFTNNFRDTKNDSLIVYLNHPNDVFNTPTGYTQKISFPRPEPDQRYFYGYPAAARLLTGNWIILFADENAKAGSEPDGNSDKIAHLWQVDLSYVRSNSTMDSARFNGLVKQNNPLTKKYDYVLPYTQWVVKSDSSLINRTNGTIRIIPPMWGDTASAVQVVGRNDNAIKWNVRGDGFTDIYNQIKIRGGSPAAARVLTSDANGLGTWGLNDLNVVTTNGSYSNQPIIVYGNMFARWYKFINQSNSSEPAFSPFFRYDETANSFLWGNANRSSMSLDTVGNLRLLASLKPAGLPGNSGDLLVSQGDNTPPVWTSTPALKEGTKLVGSSSGATNIAYFRFYDSDATTLRGAVGDGASGNTDIYLSGTSGVQVQSNGTTRINAQSNGFTAFGTHTATAIIDVNGPTGYNLFRLRQTYTPASSADANGNTGDVSWDANFIYIKTATGWKRATLSTF